MKNDQPLTFTIDDGQLIVKIGIDTLAFAFEHLDENLPFDEEANNFKQKYEVTNTLQFAKDVLIAMQDEKEDGSSPTTDFLDKMCFAALEDGSIAVDEVNKPLDKEAEQ